MEALDVIKSTVEFDVRVVLDVRFDGILTLTHSGVALTMWPDVKSQIASGEWILINDVLPKLAIPK